MGVITLLGEEPVGVVIWVITLMGEGPGCVCMDNTAGLGTRGVVVWVITLLRDRGCGCPGDRTAG